MTQSFRELLDGEGPLILPGVHDALSARLARLAGFSAYFIGGFPAVGARYGVPDVGLKSLGEMGRPSTSRCRRIRSPAASRRSCGPSSSTRWDSR